MQYLQIHTSPRRAIYRHSRSGLLVLPAVPSRLFGLSLLHSFPLHSSPRHLLFPFVWIFVTTSSVWFLLLVILTHPHSLSARCLADHTHSIDRSHSIAPFAPFMIYLSSIVAHIIGSCRMTPCISPRATYTSGLFHLPLRDLSTSVDCIVLSLGAVDKVVIICISRPLVGGSCEVDLRSQAKPGTAAGYMLYKCQYRGRRVPVAILRLRTC